MENYEQKYKHAIEQAKKELEACGSMDCDAARQIFRLFPELEKIEEDKIIDALKLAVFSYGSPIHNYINTISKGQLIYWLGKQSKQEQLYIRFGEIPSDEKSKTYRGEEEIGTENGVSVYPAFKTNEGDIVLGLNLPITKTTLYTQQHLLEYDNRPCYLVKGDYIGKDTDGQSLINNISIIEKINSYRQDNPIKKVEPKFKVGDFIVHNNSGDTCQVTKIEDDKYCIWPLYAEIEGYLSFIDVDNDYHPWTIEDAKIGDVLHSTGWDNDCIFIFNGVDRWLFDEPNGDRAVATGYCCLFVSSDKVEFGLQGPDCIEVNTIKPATRVQRNLLFRKMKEVGYEWDGEKKELKKIEQKPAWSEEDENTFASLCTELPFMVDQCYLEDITKYMFWLGTLKQRLDGTK